MKRFFIALSLFYCLCLGVQGQTIDMLQTFLEQYGYQDMTLNYIENNSDQSPRSRTNCHNISLRGKNYAPIFVPSESSPIMNVRLNLIFIQKDDGSGNFQAENEEQQDIFDDAIEDLNRIISTLVLPNSDCFEGTDEEMIHDTRIRFVDHRYYVKKSSLWNNNLHTYDYNKLHTDLSNWYLNSIDDSINNTLNDSLKGINIYFTEDSIIYHHFWGVQNPNDTSNVWTGYSNAGCSRFPNYNNWQFSSRIHFPCLYSKYWWMKNVVPYMGSFNYPSWDNQVKYWLINTISSSLAHELGHSFYLLHPQDENSSSSVYPTLNCYNTIMNNSGDSPRNFLHPNEIGRMYFNTMASNLQQYIPITSFWGGEKTINTTISFPSMKMCYSLIIGSGGNIDMPCDITFSSQGYIRVDNGGILTINNASLNSVQDTWGGIIVESGGQLTISDANIEDYNIIVKAGGSLIIQNDLTITGDHNITIEDGGYFCVSTSATINLEDEFSTIIISPYTILGCPSCNETCILSRSGLNNSGDGHIVTFEGVDYIQNITITSDYMATGNSVYAGYDVTNTKPVGSVVVEAGGNLRITANETILTKDVEVKQGGILNIR